MPSIVKVKDQETSVTSANNINNSQLLRVYASTNTIVTIRKSNNDVVGTFTIPQGRVEYVEKEPTDTIEANSTILCVPIAFNT